MECFSVVQINNHKASICQGFSRKTLDNKKSNIKHPEYVHKSVIIQTLIKRSSNKFIFLFSCRINWQICLLPQQCQSIDQEYLSKERCRLKGMAMKKHQKTPTKSKPLAGLGGTNKLFEMEYSFHWGLGYETTSERKFTGRL